MKLNKKIKTLYIYLDKECNSEKQQLKYSLFYTFFLGLFAHAFGFLNLYPSHDSLVTFFNSVGDNYWQISLGRVL